MNKLAGWIKDHAATILSWCATAGTVGGAYAAAKAVPKAHARITEAMDAKMDLAYAEAQRKVEEEYPDISPEERDQKIWSVIGSSQLTKWEKFKAGAPAFIPAALIELATIGCIQGSDILNRQKISTLNNTIKGLNESVAAVTAAYAVYRENVGKLTDPTTEYAAMKMAEQRAQDESDGKTPWDEVQTFYVEGQPQFFERTMEQVFKAEMELNRKFAIDGMATENDFYRLLGLPEVPYGDRRGFEGYLGEVYYGYRWIDFYHQPYQTPDGFWITEIVMPIEPHPLDEDEVNAELDEAICNFNAGIVEINKRHMHHSDQPDPRFG